MRHRHTLLEEITHPLKSSFVSLAPATSMLVAIGIVPWNYPLAFALFLVAVTVQLAYSRGKRPGCGAVNTRKKPLRGLYLPTVANNFISAMACGALGFNDVGILFLGAGLFSRLSTEPAILSRMRNSRMRCLRLSVRRWAFRWRPRLSPVAHWLSVNGGEVDVFAKLLFGYGLLQMLFMIRLILRYSAQAFNPSFWSFVRRRVAGHHRH